jgi:hypothetical protein
MRTEEVKEWWQSPSGSIGEMLWSVGQGCESLILNRSHQGGDLKGEGLIVFWWSDVCQSLQDAVVDFHREVFVRGAVVGEGGDVLHANNSFVGNDAPDHLPDQDQTS